jgi:hypothetical protein
LIVHNSGYTKVKFLSNRRDSWKAILLLSIILPVGLFTGLKLSGIFPTAASETVTLAPVAWLFNLPTRDMGIDQTLNATYADDSGQISFRVKPYVYVTPASVITDYLLGLRVEFTATPLNRYFSIRSAQVTFGKDAQPSEIEFDALASSENLTVKASYWGEEAAVLLLGNGSNVGCRFSALARWYLPTADNVTYERQLDFEVTYFNGTAYKTVVQPFDLTVQSVGYHYVFIGSTLSGASPEVINNVSVWVDGVEHSTPLTLIVKEAVHNITAASTIYVGGQDYVFYDWSIGPITATWICNVTEDIGDQNYPLNAIYHVVTGGMDS